MKIRIFATFILLIMMTFITIPAFANTLLKPISLYDGNIIMRIPAAFNSLPDNDQISEAASKNTQAKFATWQRPKYVFIDKKHNNLIVQLEHEKLLPNELAENMELFSQHFINAFPYTTIYDKKMIEINGRKFALIKIKAPATDSNTTLYSTILYTSFNQQKLSFTIFMDDHDYVDWENTMQKIISSIKINESAKVLKQAKVVDDSYR